MPTELEIRKEQKGRLFDYLEIRESLAEKNRVLELKISRLKAQMLKEDIADVEKEFNAIFEK